MQVRRWAPCSFLLSAGTVWIAGLAAPPVQGQAPRGEVNFSRDILPILSDKCFKCHGPDAGYRKANMRLDVPEGAFANRGGRFPIVPGKPEDSLVVKRINNSDNPMPPVESGKVLTKQERDLIARWIVEGAKYSRLWSFEPLSASVPVPKVEGKWPRDDIDRFILARLNTEHLKPSPAATRERWLRRVTLDLTGLPPTETEIADFLADKRKDAFEVVVDRLLASPYYGERMAVDWLDAARYSDSYGYQSDLLMPTWPYRDWVVGAFNKNLPYDQFLIDQIAGDLLPNATREQHLATAFNRLHRQSNEGGSIALEFKTFYAADRVDTFGTAVLGLTLGCAKCHDHKFDPITQKEYYQLFAYFNSIDEYGLLLSTEIVPTPSILLPSPEQEVRLNELRALDRLTVSNLGQSVEEARSGFNEWRSKNPGPPSVRGPLAIISFDRADGDKFVNEGDGKVETARLGKVDLVEGHAGKAAHFEGDNGIVLRGLPARERWEPFTWSFWINDPRQVGPIVLLHRTGGTDVGFCGFDLMLEDGYLTARVMRHWPGNAVAVRTRGRVSKDKWTEVAWVWDGSGRASGLKLYIDGKLAETTVLAEKLWKKINAYGDLAASGGEWSFGQRFRDAGFKGGALDDVVFFDRALCGAEVRQLFDGQPFGEAEIKETYVYSIDEKVQSAGVALQKSQSDLATHEEGIPEVSVMEESTTEIPAYLLARGQYDAPRTDANRVYRDVPKSLPNLPSGVKNDRLALAEWATQPDHPLTARVAVNRLWQLVFGTGLVETSENFGVQGSRPTHPELLDFLARRFVDSGWNVKAILRQFVLSATYRQDSVHSDGSRKADPKNRLFARGPSNRLTAEMVRDTVLFASGLLNPKIGGPPVNPYQPAGIWQENNTMSPGFVQSKGADLYRRSIYSTWKRTTPVPGMLLFDATSRESCMVRRPSTNTPLQALLLMNDVQFIEAARVLAENVLKSAGSDQDRLRHVFVRLAGRAPDQKEVSVLLKSLVEQRSIYLADNESAKKLVTVGDSKPDPALDPVELAAMTVTVQAVMNSDAVIWKR